MTAGADRDSFEALVIELGEARVALPSACVVEVARMVAIAPLPGAPPLVAGTIAYRGTVVPVLELRPTLGLPAREPRPADHLVILRSERRTVAVAADRAAGLARIERTALVPAARLARGTERLEGAWVGPDGVIVLAAPERFLDEAEERSLARALAANGAAP